MYSTLSNCLHLQCCDSFKQQTVGRVTIAVGLQYLNNMGGNCEGKETGRRIGRETGIPIPTKLYHENNNKERF